jgi:signal transduction histidine kinase
MRAETASLATQLDRAFRRDASRKTIQRIIKHDSELLGKRIILLDRSGRVRYDSARWTPFSRGSWRVVDLSALRRGQWASLQAGGRFGLQSPLFVRGREVGAVALVVTAADTGIPWGQIMVPLLGVLGMLLLVGLVIAFLLARSLARPLRHVSAGMARIADGAYDRRVPEEGWSEARVLARRYNAMVAEVARSRQLQRDFVANAAHELKTPVALVAGFARSLADGTAQRDGATADAVAYIRSESEHLAQIVEHLFALARLDADTGALLLDSCRPDAIVREVAARFARPAMRCGTTVDVECEPDLPKCVWDRESIAAVLTNLIDNALEHSGAQYVAIRVESAGADVIIEIVDRGRGIAPDDLPHVFDRFYRGRAHRRGGHAGLGLALVREVVERHGGNATVISEVGVGTTFTLTLPIVAAGAQPEDGAQDMTA